jgi:hypothetical protein
MQQKLRGLDYVERDETDVRPADLQRVDVLYSIVSGLAFADPALGRVLQAELMKAALECGEPVRVCLALTQEVCYAGAGGSRNARAVAAVGARLQAIAERLGHPHLVGLADTARGIAAYMRGQWREARGHLETGLAVLRDHGVGVRWEIDIGESYWLASLYYLGEWREMARQTQPILRDAIERGDVVSQLAVSTGRSNLAWLFANRPEEARAQLSVAEASLAPGFHLPHVFAIQAACCIDLYVGDVATAGARLDRAWPQIERVGALRIQHLRVELMSLRARIALADASRPLEERVKLARAIADDLVKEGAPWAIALGQLLRAATQYARRDDEGAVITLLAAENHLVAAGMMGWLYVARLRRGRVEGGPGGAARVAAARDLLNELGAVNPDRIAAFLVPWPA